MPFAVRDGVRLAYTDSGSGSPPLLFVHGWCCSKENWVEQVRAFRRTNRVVTVDLRGHGTSDAPEQDYTIDGFAADLEWLIGQLGLRKPVVIGHSMGGLTTLILARRKEVALRAIVLVDSSMFIQMSQAEIDGLLRGLAGPGYTNVAKIIIDNFFAPSSPKALRKQLTKELLSTPQHVLSPAMNSLAATMRPDPMDIGIPSLFIDAGRSFDELKLIEQSVPGIEIARTNGTGHFNMIEAPDQVNAMVRTFLAQLGAKRK